MKNFLYFLIFFLIFANPLSAEDTLSKQKELETKIKLLEKELEIEKLKKELAEQKKANEKSQKEESSNQAIAQEEIKDEKVKEKKFIIQALGSWKKRINLHINQVSRLMGLIQINLLNKGGYYDK